MAKEKRKKKNGEEKGEVFYKAYPIAHPIGRVEPREKGASYMAESLLWWALGIVETVLLVRIVLAAFGADGGNMLTSFLYAISYPFVWFFFYLFNTLDRVNVTTPRFEIETLAAMAFYYVLVYVIVQLIIAFRGTE
ncbi:hypothetical protein C4544_07040 [candidate division WS5 bacterium]|uniref:YggT family protein n=1 Tax=candidate division WS5 bacterium TaxID=2093353 RepID=A0A419DAI7_9BACT|nr:MAG: hypothetical protein C4544_07040 [candidate division WS5 bacterium]